MELDTAEPVGDTPEGGPDAVEDDANEDGGDEAPLGRLDEVSAGSDPDTSEAEVVPV